MKDLSVNIVYKYIKDNYGIARRTMQNAICNGDLPKPYRVWRELFFTQDQFNDILDSIKISYHFKKKGKSNE